MSKIIGQDKLIKEVNRIFQVFINSNCKIRPHFILTGEGGSGKSFTIKQLCDMNELSFLEVNAAQITKEGISGNSLSKILSPLVNYSHTPIVVFVDEFDKLFINGNRKESIDVICRISNTEDLFLLVQVGDILDRQEVEWDLHITYLMSMRMDRVMSFNRPFSLKVVCNMLNSLGYRNIYVLEAHSSRTFHLLGDRCLPWEFGHHSWIPAQSNIVFPDHGAKDRYGSNYSHYGYLVFKKERNLETGRIESFEIEESKNCYYSTFVFIDDLCDAGGTFLGELKVLKERYPNSKFIIIVCHAVNDKGLINMCNNFDQVIVSNSHRDINYRPSNENLTVIDVCK